MADENLDEDGRPIPVWTPPQVQQVDLRSQPIEETKAELDNIWEAIHNIEHMMDELKRSVDSLSTN
jgi:hypothetical protein